jgi:glucokinase
MRYAIGVDLGATTIKAGIVGSDGTIVYEHTLPTPAMEGPRKVVEQIVRAVRDATDHAQGKQMVGVGLGAPGVVGDDGVVKSPPNFSLWNSFPLARELEEVLGMVVRIENDANAAALAEARFGAGRKHPSFLFVIWGTGVGGGIILDGKLYRGPTGGAGEIGHVCIDYNGPLCNCGSRGCVEAFVGQRYLSQRTVERLRNRADSRILQLVGGNPEKIEPYYIARAAHEGDPLAKEILTEAGALLGVALGGIMNVFDLRVSIIGGGVSGAGSFVLAALHQSVQAHVLKHMQPEIVVLPAALGNKAGMLGAAGLVLE